jgi:phosphoribosyl-ATP pyrophosphohydrolase
VSTQARPLDKLERTIADRAENPNPKSYTSQLLAGGVEKIGEKIVEESMEVVEAASEPAELTRRFGVSGLDEKASRKK